MAQYGLDADYEARFDDLYTLAKRPCWRLLRNHHDAEEAAAEAMARLYFHWRRLSQSKSVEAWVIRVSTNIAIDKLRHNSRRRLLQPNPRYENPDNPDTRVTVAQALRRLPRRQRQLLVLHYFVDMTEAEIADALNLNIGTVKTHLTRARRSLAQKGGLHDLG